MILIDTLPLVALIDKADKKTHTHCVDIFRSFSEPPLTTWPCLTEALYFLGQSQGWNSQRKLLGLIQTGAIRVHYPGEDELNRITELMAEYEDTPMDFADASLVVLAEGRRIKAIFTSDSDFHIYRIDGKDSFDVISAVSP